MQPLPCLASWLVEDLLHELWLLCVTSKALPEVIARPAPAAVPTAGSAGFVEQNAAELAQLVVKALPDCGDPGALHAVCGKCHHGVGL